MNTKCVLNRLFIILGLVTFGNAASGQIVTLTPADINGGDTTTAVFDDGSIQLTASIGNMATTFNDNSVRLGVDGNGTNNGAFNDPDTDPNNDNDERLGLSFASAVGLSQIGWDFSRADGMDGGVFISGFVADPLASFSGQATGYTSTYDSMTGILSFEIPFETGFSGDDGFLDLGNLSASAGQALTLRVADIDQAGAQLAITSISYGAIPEPMAAVILLPLLATAFGRRR